MHQAPIRPTPPKKKAFVFPWWKRWWRWYQKALWYSGLVMIGALVLLLLPPVQTQLTHLINQRLSQSIGFDISIRSVSIRWIDELKLMGIYVEDPQGNPMIDAEVLNANFSIVNLIRGGDLYIDQVVLADAKVMLVSEKEGMNFSEFISRINALSKSNAAETDTLAEPLDVHIDNIILDNVRFIYDDRTSPKMEDGLFDYNHIDIRQIYGVADNFLVARDTISLDIRSLNAISSDDLVEIHRFSSFFRYRKEAMEFLGMDAKLNDTQIGDSLTMSFQSTNDLKDFNNLVTLTARLDSSIIDTRDLSLFAPSLREMEDIYTVSGKVEGKVSDLTIKELKASFGDSSSVRGNMYFAGLPNIDSTTVDIHLDPSSILARDLAAYLPIEGSEGFLQEIGLFNLEGDFEGLFSNFRAAGKLKSKFGYIETDLKMLLDKKKYNGYVKTKRLNIGKLLGQNQYVQFLDMEGEISGRGFSIATADLRVDAAASNVGVMGYEYDSLYLNAHIKQNLFEGYTQVIDPNLRVAVDGSINFLDSTFKFTTQLDTLNLKPTNLASEDGSVQLNLKADFRGLDPSKVSGDLLISAADVFYGINDFQFDSLRIGSYTNPVDSLREISVRSNILALDAKGQFTYQQLLKDASRLMTEVQLYFSGQDSLKNEYYQSEDYLKVKDLTPYWIDCKLVLYEDANSGLRLLDPYIYLEGETDIAFKASTGVDHKLSLSVSSPSIIYKSTQLWENNIRLDLSKPDSIANMDILASIESKQQQWGGLSTKNLALKLKSENEKIELQNYIEHANSSDLIDLQSLVSFYQDSIVLDLSDTHFNFLDKEWGSRGDSRIVVLRDFSKVRFDEVIFAHKAQELSLNGVASQLAEDKVEFSMNDIDLGVLSSYLGQKVSGRARATAAASQVFGDLHLDSDIGLIDIYIDDYLLGSFESHSEWDPNKDLLSIQAYLERDQFQVLNIKGDYRPQEPNPRKKLDMTAYLNGLSLKILQPFAKDFVSGLKGTGIGVINIKGSPGMPLLKGNVLVHKGQFTVNYLNTTYRLSDQIKIKEDFIGMDNLKLYDQDNQKAYLNGGVYHHNFSNFLLQIDGKMKDFTALNTKPSETSMYYGTAVATGSISVFGPPNDLDMIVNAKTEKGTKIYIPLDGYASVSESDFISFVQQDTVLSDSVAHALALEAVRKDADISGIKMDFNVELTPDAYCEIIFDKKAGDIIRGHAKGKIKMEIDLLGEFSMYGDVEVLDGSYNFTLLNVINKQFGVQPNSFIRWSGDPYEAQLDITATYSQKSSLIPVFGNNMDSTYLNAPELRRAYPIEVLLHLQGDLLSPDITFGLDVNDYPSIVMVGGQPVSLESYVAGFEQRLRNDEQELNKQVFSLIALKRLSLENTFSGITQSAGSSVSELFSNQLSYWVSQVDENLEIDVDLNGLTAEALNSFQLNLSYTTLNGRLRISREGGFTNLQNEADLTSVIGDWTLEYLLRPDGKLRLKMYRKHNANTLLGNTAIEGSATNGVSILRSKSFDTFGELFRGDKKPKKQKAPNSDNGASPESAATKEEQEETNR